VISASAQEIVPYSENTLWTPNVDTLLITTASAGYNFLANTPYVRSKLWYSTGSEGVALIDEFTAANVTANVITTEDSIEITTEGAGGVTPTDGTGLYNSTTIQALFVKSS
jgi:hypothetical protein